MLRITSVGVKIVLRNASVADVCVRLIRLAVLNALQQASVVFKVKTGVANGANVVLNKSAVRNCDANTLVVLQNESWRADKTDVLIVDVCQAERNALSRADPVNNVIAGKASCTDVCVGNINLTIYDDLWSALSVKRVEASVAD